MRFQALFGSFFAVVLLVITSSGCFIGSFINPAVQGSGVAATENREVEDFHSIELSGSGVVHITCGQEPSLSITVDDNLLELFKTDVKEGVLEIYPEKGFRSTVGAVFVITTNELKSIKSSGSGTFNVSGVASDDFKYSVAGSGKFTADGEVKNLEIEIAGSGKVELAELAAQKVSIGIAGSGRGLVNASESLDVSIAGSGKIEYIGSPEVSKDVAGSGKVVQRPSAEKAQEAEAEEGE